MRKKRKMKIARGRLEEERRKSEDKFEYQRVMLFVLPLVMIAVLVVGVYFGYLSFQKKRTPLGVAVAPTTSTEIVLSEDDSEYLLTVVNSAAPVSSDFVPQLSECAGVRVSSLMVNDLNQMLSDAKNAKLNIKVKSAYISFEEQKEKYEKAVSEHKKKNKSSTVKAEAAVKKTTPNAGDSEQQTGLVVELTKPDTKDFSKTAEYDWLIKNCVNYGFVLRYPEKENTGGLAFSPSMFRYVGVENARMMRSYDMNLDEFVKYLGIH